jgi:hypothetical protein
MAKAQEQDEPSTGEILNRLTMAIEILAARQAQGEEVQAGVQERLAAALDRLGIATIEAGRLQAAEQRRIHRPSNEVVPMVSVLNPRGDNCIPKPRLKCIMMIPWLVDPESITREEAQLLNLLEQGEYVITRSDGMRVKITVKIDFGLDEITPSRLLMNNETAFNNDNHKWMPPLSLFLRQVLRQHKDPATVKAANDVLTMDEELALMQAENYVAIPA